MGVLLNIRFAIYAEARFYGHESSNTSGQRSKTEIQMFKALVLVVLFSSSFAFAQAKDFGSCAKERSLTSTSILEKSGPYVPLICKDGKLKQLSSYEFTTLINGFYSKYRESFSEPSKFAQLVKLDSLYDKHAGAAGFTFRQKDFTDTMIKEVKGFVAVKFEMDAERRSDEASDKNSSKKAN
jgi:hypothetical protein